MQISGGGGDRRQKDDVYSPPIHKTAEFKNVVKQIKERDAAQAAIDNASSAATTASPTTPPKQPTFNVPMPGSSALPPKKTGPHHASMSLNQTLYDKELEKSVRNAINKEYSGIQPPVGTNPNRIKEFIDKKVAERVDIIKKPRYVFLSDGTPFLLTKKDERLELVKSLLDESPWKQRWTLAKYDIANAVGKITQLISEPSLRTKEILTDTSEGNVVGGVAQLGYNSALLGLEYLRGTEYNFRTQSLIDKAKQDAEAVKYTDPPQAAKLLDYVGKLEEQKKNNQAIEDRISVAKQAVKRSWATLNEAWDYTNKSITSAYDPNMKDPITGAPMTPLEQAAIAEREKQKDAAAEAPTFRAQAQQAYATGNYEKALELTKQAIEADRRGSSSDYYGAYTWIREPEREKKFTEDAALLELQKGAPLDKEEIRRLKEFHANSWTEIGGELIFDPINLVPASIMEDVIKLPFKGVAKASEAVAKEFPVYSKTLEVLGTPVRWLRRQSVTSGASQIAVTVHNQLQRISSAYSKSDDMVKALDQVGDFVMEAKAVRTEAEAQAIFETATTKVPGLQTISFNDFKQLMDAAEHVPAADGAWGKIFSDALTKAEDDMTHIATRLGKDPTEIVSDISKSRRALMTTSNTFKEAFTDAHRIFKGSSFVDDTISGWTTKVMRELSGEEVNDLLKTNKLDEFLTKYSTTLSPKAKNAWKYNRQIVESVLHRTAQLRDFWAKMVLSTPRWIMNNLPDTAMRDVVAGGSLFDDMVTLFTSTQRTLADDLGFVPAELSQKISSAGIDFGSDVPTRLLYDGWKPKAGLFSYIKYEFERLAKEDHALAKREIIDGMLSNLPTGKLRNALGNLLDGFSNVPLALNAYADGIGSFNEAIEFTFRLRMFHREYFKLLETVEPEFMARGLSNLSPATKAIAQQIWQAAEGNPRRVTAYAEALVGKSVKGTPAEWAFIVPPDIDKVTKGMDIADRQVFITSIRNELDAFIDTSTKAGKDLGAEDFNKFFDNYVDKFRDEMQARMSQTHDVRGIDGSLATDAIPSDTPDINKLKGSLPLPKDEAPINAVIEKATSNLKRGKRATTGDIVADFQTAISEHAKIETVKGTEIRVVRRGQDAIIQIGEDAAKKKATQLYDDINEAVVQVFKNTDTDLILRSGFRDVDHYEQTFRKFIDDATAVYHEDERQFLTIVNEMETHPRLKTLLQQTLPKDKVLRYDSTMDVYRDLGVYSDSYGFLRPPEDVFEDAAQALRPVPGSHIAAAHNMGIATHQLAEHAKTLEPELAAKVTQFLDPFTVYRQELKQVYSFLYPGPLLKSTTGEGRHAAWDLFYKMSEDEFLRETEVKKTLLQLLQSNPEKAAKYMDDASSDFVTFFLKKNGITLDWDANHEILMNVRITTPNGLKNFTDRRDLAYVQRRLFTTDISKKLAENPLITIRSDVKLQMKRQLRNALRDTFDVPTRHADAWATAIDSHAQQWAEITDQPIEKYYERLGFQKLEGEATQGLAVKENFRVTKRGAVSRTPDGGFTFYGLGQSNFESMVRETGELFFDDLVSMADHNPQSADDLKALIDLITEKTGKKIKGNRLEKVHSDALAEMFTGYVHTGVGPNIKVKDGLEKFKTWLSSTFDAVKDTPITGEMSDDTFRVMDRLFNEGKLKDVPKTNRRTIRLMAQEAGFGGTDEELLKTINEFTNPTPKINPAWNDVENKLASGRTVNATEYADRPILQAAYDENVHSYPAIGDVVIPKQRGLNPEQRMVEAHMAEALTQDFDGMVTKYVDSLPATEKNVLNVDHARELSPEYAQSPEARMKYAAATQKPSSMLIREIWRRRLAEPLQGVSTLDKVVFTVGGGGSGKSSALSSFGEISQSLQNSHVVWDMTMSEMRDLQYVEQALAQGRNVQMVYVARDPVESLVGIAKRATENGRIVPLTSWAEAHTGSPQTFRAGLEKFADNPNLGIIVIDNTRGAGQAVETTPDFLKTWNYEVDDLLKRGEEALTKGVENGEVRPDIYKAITGKEPPGTVTNPEQLATRTAEIGQPGIVSSGQPAVSAGSIGQPQLGNKLPIKSYANLGDVPKDVLAQVLSGEKSKLADELQQGWEAWRTQRGLVGFPDDALSSLDSFKDYLHTRMGQEWSEASNYYNRLIWETEQFEDSMLNYHAGDDFAEVLFPRVHEANISNGMKTFLRNQETMGNGYESSLQALDHWKQYMANGGHSALVLPKEAQAELLTWSKGAATDKSEMLDLLLHGNGDNIEGALDKTNHFMLDYQHTSIFDQTMKNFFPFWMFPSRSFPFWAETMATHPQLISNYEKIQRLSRSQRYQAGAVTSTGKPLPSLDGYIKLPGTDLWFNPIAPLSFRYVLDIQKSKDDTIYAANSEEEVEPKAFMVKSLMETSQIYGFSMAPWMTYLMKKAYNVSDTIIPGYPMIPEIQLIPRWMVSDLINKANKVNLFGMDWQGLGQAVYPEAPWHDYMVERRILENALGQIISGNLSEADKIKLMNQAQNAIKYKGEDVLWKSSYKELTNEEWTRSVSSFFSGMYPKNFGDNQAEMLQLRNELNLLKSAMNNEFQANVFDLPVQADTAWNNYLNALDTPEGWNYRLYTDVGWVKNAQGELVRDPKERNKWLAIKIKQDEDQQVYYDKMADLQTEFNKRIRALPVGTDWEQMKVVYDWYSHERSSLDYLRSFEKVYGTNKPVELIQQDIAKDWFRELGSLKPRWEITSGETYEDYKHRVTEWETNLPKIAPLFMRAYLRRQDLTMTLNSLHEDQKFDMGAFSQELVAMSNTQGLETWEKENDDVFDALNKAWKATYWDSYWNSVIGKSGYEVDLAEHDFYNNHNEPPSANELYRWITAYYGVGKFTQEEITKWVDGTDTMSVEQRQLLTKDDPVDFKKRQEVWDMLSWIGPGNRNRDVFNTAFVNAGGDPDALTVWYEESGEAYKSKPDKLDQLHDAVEEAIKTLGLKPPDRPELVRYIQAQDENDTFKQLISSELGNQFFDFTNDEGKVQPGVFSYYNSLDKKAKKEFRSERPDQYDAIQAYYDMRDTFGQDHPTWNDYYGLETTPTVGLDTEGEKLPTVFTPPALHSSTHKNKGGVKERTTSLPNTSNYAQGSTAYGSGGSFPKFNISDRTSVHLSPGLYNLVGTKMQWEITQKFASGRHISSSGISFLRSIASRYPEYYSEIQKLIS